MKLTNGMDAGGFPISNLADPAADQDAATKKYVDYHPIYPGYISGLELRWNSATSISIGPAAAEIEATGKLIINPVTITTPSLSLSAGTAYFVYLSTVLGIPSIEVSAIAPASPYAGTARSKTGDTSKRYVGWLLTDSSGNIRPFSHFASSGLYLFKATKAAGVQWGRIVNGGNETVATTVDCSALVPPGCTGIRLFLINTGTQAVLLAAAGDTLDANNYQTYSQQATRYPYDLALSGTAGFKYMSSPPGGILYADLVGVYLPR